MSGIDIENIDQTSTRKALEEASESLNHRVEVIRLQHLHLLVAHRATDKETQDHMSWVDGYLAAWRDEELERLHNWLLREGETVQ